MSAVQQPTPSAPIPVVGKNSYLSPYHTGYRPHDGSPPEVAESSTTSGRSTLPSYTASASSSNYAASGSEYDSSASGSSIDLMELLNDRLQTVFDPIPLDKSLVKQAQASGELNAKQRELMELQALAQRRLASTRANLADGMKAAKEVKRDLEWTQKRVSALNAKTQERYPTEYAVASSMYPAPVDS